MKFVRHILATAVCLATLTSCAGYKMGYNKPTQLHSIHSVSIPLFENQTQEQRLATLVTNSTIDSITRDGTYSISAIGAGDAELVASIESINYSKRRSSRFDSLLASELYVELTVEWSLIDTQNNVLMKGKNSGRSQFSVVGNQQLSRTNSLADAAKDVGEQITLRLANGF